MAVVNMLPNGYLVVTLSPREATMLVDQILDPKDFPWQSSESEMIALEVKMQLKKAIERKAMMDLQMMTSAIPVEPPPPPDDDND
jgi:hypothetical protein